MSQNNRLAERLQQSGVLLADGATGTTLFKVGLETGDAPELWNIDHPDRIRDALHRPFVSAGSDIILSNSFGGTRYRLKLHGAEHRVAEINQAAARLARDCADECTTRTVLVGGSMGPTGEILQPNGALGIDEAAEAFAEQARALAEGGVDVLWIETMSSAEEIIAAVRGAATTALPIVFTVSIDTNGRTMMGLTAHDTMRISQELPGNVTALGTNCGVGAAEVVAAIVNLGHAAEAFGIQPALVAKANCGIPEYVNGEIVYNGTPELMARYAVMAADAGASIIGGCCGTSAEHVAAMRQALDERTPAAAPDVQAITRALGEISQGARAQLAGDLSVAGGSASGRGARGSRRRRSPDADATS